MLRDSLPKGGEVAAGPPEGHGWPFRHSLFLCALRRERAGKGVPSCR